MNDTLRWAPRVAVTVFILLLFIVPTGPRERGVVHGFQQIQAPDLDRALRAQDLSKARELVPANWAGAEALFVDYLERAYTRPGATQAQADARTLAARLADVFFRIVEYDFARSLVTTLDAADASRRAALVEQSKALFACLEQRRTLPRSSTDGTGYNALGLPIFGRLSLVADRFHELSFPRGELFTLFCMADINPPVPRLHRLAREVGDDLSLALAQRQSAGEQDPDWDTLIAIAERRGLLSTQLDLLSSLGRLRFLESRQERAPSPKLEEAVKHLEKARLIAQQIPLQETVKYAWYTPTLPQFLTSGMPELFGAYVRLRQLQSAEQVLADAMKLGQPFGEEALLNALTQYAYWASGVEWNAAAPLIQASRALGPKAELRMVRGLAGSGREFQPEIAEKALALAVAIPDSRERALTLAWYSRTRRSNQAATARPAAPPGGAAQPVAPAPVSFPPLYDQLLKMCLDAGEFQLVAEALIFQADMQGAGGNVEGARETFNQAIQVAERTNDRLTVAQVLVQATTGMGPSSSTLPGVPGKRWPPAVQLDFANRAIAAAKASDTARELMIAFWARAMVPTAASGQRVEDLRAAATAAERYAGQTGQVMSELRCLALLSREYVKRGEYQAAVDTERRRAERAREYSSAPYAGNEEFLAYSTMATIYSTNLGEPSLAFEAADRARVAAETQLEPVSRGSDVNATLTYKTLAAIASALGRPSEALQFLDTALEKAAAAGPGDRELYKRIVLTERAQTYSSLGDYQMSLADWNEVQSLMGPTARNYELADFLQKAQWLSAVAWTHALNGDLDGALTLARNAVAEFRQDKSERWTLSITSRDVNTLLLTENAQETIASLIASIADVLVVAGRADEAIAFCDLENIRRQLAERPVAQRVLRQHLAEACVAAGQLDRARGLLLSAVDIDRAHATAESGGLGGSLLALGKLETTAGNYTKAKEYLLAARAAANAYDFDQIWQIERALARVLSRAGDADGAEAHSEYAVTALESTRERLRADEFRLRYGESRDEVYQAHANLLAAKALLTRREEDAERAFKAAERRRTQLLWSLLAAGWSRMPVEAIPDQVRRVLDMEARIGAKQVLLRDQFALAADRRDKAMVDALERDLQQLQADHSRLLASIAQGQYRYAAPTVLAGSLAGPVRAALGPSRVLVEYLVTAERSYAFVVSSSGVKVVPLTAGRSSLRQQVERLLTPFRRLRAGDVDLARLEYDMAAAHDLYKAVFAPVLPHLGPLSDVVVVADDVLNFLPFDALLEQAPRPHAAGSVIHAEFIAQPYLLSRYTISYLTSAAELLTAASPARSRPVKTLFAMANPTAAPSTSATVAHDDPLRRQLRSGRFGQSLSPLPGAEAEVRGIARNFPSASVSIVSGEAATEKAYESQAGDARFVHFATHAVASDGQPLYSTLILAPDSAAGDDGFLQAYEVLRTPLRADLVALSACETALGAEDWGQGLVGLVAAFEQAGARSVLATLWGVDEATEQVMTGFYGAMARGSSPPSALRQAKLQLLEQRVRIGRTEVSLAHPFFWAPFILVGAPASR